MIGFSASSMAQDLKSQVNAVIAVKNNPDALKDQLKVFKKAYKKDADAYAALGRAFLEDNDTVNAKVYADQAIEISMDSAPALLLQGDIESRKDNGSKAVSWYNLATIADPKNPDGFVKYAIAYSKINPQLSIDMLTKLKQNVPDYPVDLIFAGIYDRTGDYKNAIAAYDKVDRSKMKDYELAQYAFDNFLLQDSVSYLKSLEITKYGLQKSPRNPALNRIAFYNLTNLKRYPEALTYADKLFNQSDSAKITGNDYLYYGYAYMGNNDNKDAIVMFNKAIENSQDNKGDVNDALKNIAAAYEQEGDYNNATAAQKKYIDGLEVLSAYDLSVLATMYLEQADQTTDATVKATAYNNADGVYAEMGEKFPTVMNFAVSRRAYVAMQLDPDLSQGLAKPYYEQLISIINANPTKTAAETSQLLEANNYLGVYYTQHDDDASAKPYWQKVLELDPNNANAKLVLGIK